MPGKPQRPCKTIGCKNLTRERLCGDCLGAGKGKESRPEWKDRLYGREWKGYTSRFLSIHKWCADPFSRHLIPEVGTVVDHIQPHKGEVILFWNSNNHQALCKSCHDFKTATEDGGFGRMRVRSSHEIVTTH